MINGTHAIVFAEDAEKARAFFRDVLGFPYVDAHGGWLIFKMPPAELGIHPAERGRTGTAGGRTQTTRST
jgi:catechol 2,3-dioxygenase-like lactoylglutathione lyase family enzyme